MTPFTPPRRRGAANPYTSAISAAISSNAAFKKKCDAMSIELRALQREHEEASKLRQALRALQSKYDAASRDLEEQSHIVETQSAALKARLAPEVESLEAQLAASEAAVAALRKELEARKKGEVGDAGATFQAQLKDVTLQLTAAKEARDKSDKEKERMRQDCEEARRSAEELSASLLKTRHQFAGTLSSAQIAALRSDLEMTRYQLKSSSDLIDALLLQQQAGAGVKEADIKAVLAAASARGKEYVDACLARDEYKASAEALTRQLMAARRKGKQGLTYSSVINSSGAGDDLGGWTDVQFSDWADSEPAVRAEVDTGNIFLPENAASGLGPTGSSNAVLALESKLQTCNASLRLKESQLAAAKASLDAAKQSHDQQKTEIANLSSKLQSGLSFMSSFEAQVQERDAQVAAVNAQMAEAKKAALEWMAKYNSTEQLLSDALVSLEVAQSASSQKMRSALSSSGPAGASNEEYEKRLQEAAAYVAYQESEAATAKQESARARQTIDSLERHVALLEKMGGGGSGGGGSFQPTGNADVDDLQARVQDAQDKAKTLKRDVERQKLELEELQGLLEVRNDHIKSQQRRLLAFESGRTPPPDTEPEALQSKVEGKAGKKLAETKAALNRRITELEEDLQKMQLKGKMQEDKLTKAAEYIKYQKEQITLYINETTLLREQLDVAASSPSKASAQQVAELQAEVDEVRAFAEEFEKKLVEAAEFIDTQASEISQLQAALTASQREKLAALSIKASLAEPPKQPPLPYLSSRNDPDNIDFDECMEYLRKVDNEVARARKQEVTLATENLSLQAALKQAVTAAAAIPIFHATPPASVLHSSAAGGGGDVDAQVKEARDVAKRLSAENTKLLAQIQSQAAPSSPSSSSSAVSSRTGAKYDDFDNIVTDLINVKMELSSVRNDLEEAQAKNRNAEASLLVIQRLQDELAALKSDRDKADGKNPFDSDEENVRSSTGGGARALGGEDPLVVEARDLAKKYFGELQKAKTHISTLSAEITAARVMRSTSATPGMGPVSDAERDGLVQELINTKMEIDQAINDLEDERRKSSEFVARLNESTIKIASLEARLGNSSGTKGASKTKAIARFGFMSR